MLKVTNKVGSSMRRIPDVSGTAKRRGRPPKAMASTLATMNAQNDPDIRFIQDLTVTDRTAVVEGADPSKHYRWCEESKMRTRQFQGYVKVSDPNVKTHFDGNFMPAEGYDMRQANKGGMILCEIPKTLYQKRQAIKAEKNRQQSEAMEVQHISEMQQSGTVLGANDSFVEGLANGD